MLMLLIVGLAAGVLLLSRTPRLEGAPVNQVMASVDGKPVKSYVAEDRPRVTKHTQE